MNNHRSEKDLLKQTAKLEKALAAQKHELQIEAALEKVRAVAMKMNKPDELEKVVAILFEKLSELGLSFSGAGIFLFDHKEKKIEHWIKGLNVAPVKNILLYDEKFKKNAIVKDLWSAIERGERIFNKTYPKAVKDEFFQYTSKYNDDSKIPPAVKKFILQAKSFTLTCAAEGNSIIGLDNWSGPFSVEEDRQILKRFARVFEQAYVRFLDLQKAEAQAREAKIEAALERVRARTMAMQKSDELQETTLVLFQQFKSLGVKAAQASICVFDENTKMGEMFVTLKGEKIDRSFSMELDKEVFVMKKAKKAFLDKQKKFSYIVKGKELQDYNRWRNSLIGKKGWDESIAVRKRSWHVNGAFFSRGLMGVSTEAPVTVETLELVDRFAGVFDLTFTRFLDLQKAETQAREAEIELALERVRARTMAMQKSDELREVVKLVFEKLQELNFSMNDGAVSIVTFIEGSRDHIQWVTDPSQTYASSFYIPYSNHSPMADLVHARETEMDYFSRFYPVKEKNDFFQHLFDHTDYKNLSDKTKQTMLASKNYGYSVAFAKHSAIIIPTNSGRLLSEGQKEIFKRFVKVFEQSYVRFLDLQKAEAQTREAKIEAALERVRSHAMAMQTSEQLNALIGTVFTELTNLDLVLTRCVILIYEGNEKGVRWWMANSEAPSMPMNFFVKYADLAFFNEYLKGWQERSLKWQYILEGENKFNTDEFLFKETELSQLPDFVIAGMRAPDRVYLNASFNNFGDLTLASLEPLSDEHFDILLRFAKVFDLTYTRFNDLQNAEAQAREAKIEAALERVRSRTMAMQRSDELKDAALLLFQQVQTFGVDQWACGYNIWEADGKTCTAWMSRQGTIQPPFKTHPSVDHCFQRFYDAKQRGESFYVEEMGGDEIKTHYKRLISLPEFKSAPREFFNEFIAPDFQIFHIAYFDAGYLMFITYKPVPQLWDIFKRFAKVFEQTYTRFLDLQKAEAQAKESQIQLALERVRARTMAMYKSDELQETAFILFQQFRELGENPLQITIGIFKEEERKIEFSITGLDGTGSKIDQSFEMDIDGPILLSGIYKAWKEQRSSTVFELSGKELADWIAYRNTIGGIQQSETIINYEDRRSVSAAFFSKGFISFSKSGSIPADTIALLERFAAVFDMTYTRFLDLQKAESQAKESQIQLALERVRARTMAMQHSDELLGVVSTLYEQLNNLQFDSNACNIIIIDKETDNQRYWVSGFTQKLYPESYNVPYFKHPYIDEQLQSWKEGRTYIVIEYSGKMKQEFDKQFFSRTDFKNIPVEVQKIISALPSAKLSTAFFTYGALQIIGPNRLSEENAAILQRFAKVFDQTYTRFLDLQKAEAQAKESQIQLALERVRARTMAMQKSDELAAAAQLLYEEFKTLNINTFTCGYLFIKEEQHIQTAWVTTPDGTLIPDFIDFPLTGDHVLNKRYEDWKQKKPLHVFEIQGEANKEHHRFLASTVPDQTANEIFAQIPGRVIFYCANFSAGYLFIIATEFLTSEEEQIITRFAKVFELTYTRFSDLKQAEGQAREAQIQLALERVRARTMAMHKSVELAETAQVLFQQLQELGGIPDRIAIGVVDESAGVVNFWSTDQAGSHIDKSFKARLNEEKVMAKTYQAWKDNKKSLVIDLHGDDVKEWVRFAREEMGVIVKDDFIKDRRVHNFAFFSHGWILVTTHEPQAAETIRILERFAAVFSLTYRRFLDLEKAEAQAREAQIEAALERVRARSMAMHHSSELHTAADVLFQQLRHFGGNIMNAGIALCKQDADEDEYWLSSDSGLRPVISIPHTEDPIQKKLYEDWKNKSEFYSIAKGGDELKAHYTYLQSVPGLKPFFEEGPDWSFPTWQKWHAAYFSHGYLFMITLEPYEEEKILVRFAKVFEQAYTRFLDLKKAEAQVREAHIEAALERVRSRSLAMHKSDELSIIARTMFDQLRSLGLELEDGLIIMLFREGSHDQIHWPVFEGIQTDDTMFMVPYFDHPVMNEVYKAREAGVKFIERHFDKTFKDDFLQKIFSITDYKVVPVEFQQKNFAGSCYHYSFAMEKFTGILMHSYHRENYPAEYNNILKRFARVFEQAYVRFLDLQKAEAQAREAQIEAALERVRSKTMAMHKSEELIEVIASVFQQLEQLNFRVNSANLILNYKEHPFKFWTAIAGKPQPTELDVPYGDFPVMNWFMQQKDSDIQLVTAKFNQEEKNEWVRHLLQHTVLGQTSEEKKKQLLETPGFAMSVVGVKNMALTVTNYQLQSLSDEENEILKRILIVFDQTYTRFLDLQKAEAQARESQIQLALERVRARTMAMQHSDELKSAATLLFQQVRTLGVPAYSCGYNIWEENEKVFTSWMSTQDGTDINAVLNIPLTEDANFIRFAESRKKGEPFFVLELLGERMQQHYHYLKTIPEFRTYFDYAVSAGFALPETQIHHIANFSHGNLLFITLEPCPEFHDVFKRFAQVFDQTYTRFLDLQKAEAQAREAQIETGLERVRARTMAMHSSEDVTAATATMFTELEKLGIENLRCGITIIHKNKTQEVWSVSNVADVHADHSEEEKKIVTAAGSFDMNAHPLWRLLYDKWENKEDYLNYFLAGTDKEDYFKILNTTKGYLPQAIREFPDTNFQVYIFGESAVWSCSLQPHNEEQKQVMKRFTSVFSLTFRRYQDLKKAEAQAREATIEAALEKVRGKAMAMHNSNDLSVTASMVFTELRKLGISPIRCGVGLLNKESKKAQLYSATSSADGDSLSLVGWVILSEHPVLEKIYDSWLDNEEYYPELQGEQMRSYYQLLLKGLPVTAPQVEDDNTQYGHFLPFSVGCLYAWSETRYNETEIKVLKRFATIIDLTFRRYIELQKSEANAREAVKQAALDRIRADIASMRTVGDLERITPLIWNELTILGIHFIRCGVFIMDDTQKLIHTFLSTPDGKAIAAFHMPYDTPGNFAVMVNHWQEKKIYISHWGEVDFIGIAEVLLKQGEITTKEQYLSSLPKEGFYLHFLPFLQGMLYVGNTEQLPAEQVELIQHVADAFSTAYARYEDFNKLEAAKQQVEKTLTDLKQAQTQLVQSEKMASLGELTAGIAHEIQNPLNFVNNFSDVSNELLEEMKEELSKGNIGDAIAIAEDVKQNLEKINHHGRRADGIVKGMLQHSRTSSGQKEMTEINSLADEYLRLAYHGLRAKDKSFNAKFETDLDANVGRIDIIPQEIGRVILNLINNAFYAVSERKKTPQSTEGGIVYEPSVTLTTVKDNGKIEIRVKDNGNGIPQRILDKIFQPFFTTKPTGQGTGLGLSLAYDIVKAHGGEIKVETKEGEGSTFIIHLPSSPA